MRKGAPLLRIFPVVVSEPNSQNTLALVVYPRCHLQPSDVNDLPASLGSSAFRFVNDVKMLLPRSQSSFLRPPGPAWGNGNNQSTPKCVHVSLLGTSVTFLSLFLPQFPIIESTPSPTSKTWGFHETRYSPRIQQGHCYLWSTLSEISTSVCIAKDCAIMLSYLTYAMEADSPTPGIV